MKLDLLTVILNLFFGRLETLFAEMKSFLIYCPLPRYLLSWLLIQSPTRPGIILIYGIMRTLDTHEDLLIITLNCKFDLVTTFPRTFLFFSYSTKNPSRTRFSRCTQKTYLNKRNIINAQKFRRLVVWATIWCRIETYIAGS